MLEANLVEYRLKLTKDCQHTFCGYDLTTGFPLCAIKEIINNVERLTDEKSIWLNTSLLCLDLVPVVHRMLKDALCGYGLRGSNSKQPGTYGSIHNESTESLEDSSSDKDSSTNTESSTDNERSLSSDGDKVNGVRRRARANFRLVSNSSSSSSSQSSSDSEEL